MRPATPILLLFMLYVAGCSAVKESVYQYEESTEKTVRIEKEYIEIRDTLFIYQPEPEQSQNKFSADSSYVETSLAWSVSTWSEGILNHSIRNKPEILVRAPAMIQIHWKSDTLISDETLLLETERVKERYRFLNAFFYTSGLIVWILITTTAIWKIYRLRGRYRK